MKMLLAVEFVVWALASTVPLFAADPPRQRAMEFDAQIHVSLRYLLYIPPDSAQGKKSPLVLFLHGAGERGSDLNLVKTHGPPHLVEQGKNFPFILVSPQCPEGKSWEPFELSALIDDIVAKHPVDADRIYVTGLSMGGFGTWSLAAYAPDRFAALIPICGGGDPAWARRLSHVPIWVFHGAKDPTVPPQRSQEMVDALKKRGSNVKFTLYPEAGHDSWTATYNDPKVFEWMLEQKR